MRSFRLAILLTAMLTPLAAPLPALAQTPAAPTQGQADMQRTMYLAVHNQLGVLEYCQAQGSIGADTVAIQQRVMGMLPPMQMDGLDEAEATGKRGVVVFAGSQVPIADAAKTQNTTPDAMCKRMEQMLQAQAAQLPK